MMRRRFPILIALCLWFTTSMGQPPPGYYTPANGLSGTALRGALHDIIDNHTVSTYTELWTHFQSTDKKSDGKVWDMYSDKPGLTPPYTFTFVTDQCGNYSKEGDCYNREHSFPKSWFGGEVLPMYTDLFHLFPTDGWVNNKRGNYPFGPTSSPTWTSMNGSKVGPSSWPGYTGVVFEPIDAYKGDFARAILYMGVRYYTEDTSWPGSDMVTGSAPVDWAKLLLLKWHNDDPVSVKETDRNNAIYIIQGNRNPFVDKPEYAALLWGSPSSYEDPSSGPMALIAYPIPARDRIRIVIPDESVETATLSILSLTGTVLTEKEILSPSPYEQDLSFLPPGTYIIIASADGKRWVKLVPVIR